MKDLYGYLIGLGVLAVLIVLHGLGIFAKRRFVLVDWAREELKGACHGGHECMEDLGTRKVLAGGRNPSTENFRADQTSV